MSPLTTLAPDTQATWFPDWLVEITLASGIRRYAYGGDIDQLSTAYDGRIIAEPSVERGMADELWGAVAIQDVTLELSNAGGELTPDFVAGYQSRPVTIKRFDRASSDLVIEFIGIVSRAALARARVRLDCRNVDKSVLEDMVPKALVTTALFPKAVDVGAVVPVVFGNVPRVPVVYVNDDLPGSLFDYVIAAGTVSVTGLYRNGQNDSIHPIGFAECVRAAGGAATSWAEVARTDLYAGYTAVRFILRQTDFNNSLHRIFADVTGLVGPRNFARAVRTLLQNALWGLNQTANVANFAVAEALLPANLFCDGAMLEQRQAREWLAELLMVRGMRLGIDTAGTWTIAVDTQATTRRLIAQDGVADGERTLIDVGERTGPTLDDTIKDCVIRYRRDHITSKFLFDQRRSVNASKGKDRIYEHHFLRNHEAADRVADYVGKRLLYDQERVEITLGQPARKLVEGDIVAVLDPTIGYNTATDLEVFSVRKTLTSVVAKLRGWAEAIYTYTAGTLPTDNVTGTEQDNTRTFPDNPTTPTFVAEGTRTAGDGHVTAWITLSTTVPTTNVVQAIMRYRVAGTTPWLDAGTSTSVGALTFTVEGLLPATTYDYSSRVLNVAGLHADSGVYSRPSASDATIPTAPTSLVVVQAGARVVQITVYMTAPPDWGVCWLYRNAVGVNDPNAASTVLIQTGKKIVFHDEDVTYGTTYRYWIKVLDTSLNASAFSPAGGPITVARIVTNDVDDNQITTPKLPFNAVSNTVFDADVGSQNTTSTSPVQYAAISATLSVTSTSSLILIGMKVELALQNNSAGNLLVRADVYIRANGGGITKNSGSHYLPAGQSASVPLSLTHVDGPGRSGSVTYTIHFNVSGGSMTAYMIEPALQVTELKR